VFEETVQEVVGRLLKTRTQVELTPETDYIAIGAVDSLSLLHFVIELENELGVEISNEEIVLPEFRTVGGLTDLMLRKVSP